MAGADCWSCAKREENVKSHIEVWVKRHAANEKELFSLVLDVIGPLKREIKALEAVLALTDDQKNRSKLESKTKALFISRKRFAGLWRKCNESCRCLKYLRGLFVSECSCY